MEHLGIEINQQAEQWLRGVGLADSSIGNLADFTRLVAQFFRGGNWLFRGEGDLYPSPATPSILRDSPALTNARYPDWHISDQEAAEIERCRADHAAGTIRDRYLRAFMPLMHRYDVNWLPLARHFGFKTRLLDVTFNPLVALFFACLDTSEGEYAYVYAIQSGSFRPVNGRNPEQRNRSDYPPIPISFIELFDVDVHFWGGELDRLPYLFEPTIPQERMQAQAGRFLFWRDTSLILPEATRLVPVRINGSNRDSLLAELSAFGVTKNVLFPDQGT